MRQNEYLCSKGLKILFSQKKNDLKYLPIMKQKKSLPKDKLKPVRVYSINFAEDNYGLTDVTVLVEKSCGKRKNARFQHFPLYPTCY